MAIKDWWNNLTGKDNMNTTKQSNEGCDYSKRQQPAQEVEDYVWPTQTYNISSIEDDKVVTAPQVKSQNEGTKNGMTKLEVPARPKPTAYDQDKELLPSISADIKPVGDILVQGNQRPKTVTDTPPVVNHVIVPTSPPIQRTHPKEVIAFVVENSADVLTYKDEVLKIIKNIVDSKKASLFLFLRIGNGGKFFELMDYDDVTKGNIVSNLLSENASNVKTGLTSALFHIKGTLKKSLLPKFTFKKLLYNVSTFSIICIGSGAVEGEEFAKKAIASCIEDLKEFTVLKGIKYFCIKDRDAIKVAALGFPVIGHIIPNFYE